MWNILEAGVGTLLIFIQMVNIFMQSSYLQDCSKFYGIDAKYFDGALIIQDKMIFLVGAAFLAISPFLFGYVNSQMKGKAYSIFSFLVIVFLFFCQNLIYTSSIIDAVECEWLLSIINNNITIIVFLISDIILAYFLCFKIFLGKIESLSKMGRIVFALALGIYVFNTCIGVSISFNRQVSDKKTYEVIDDNKVVVTNYEGRFLVMDCEVREEILYIKKGEYSFIDMTGVDIKYNRYKDVQCK